VVREPERQAIDQVRTFNRTVAERIGALSDEFLGRARPMGESRTLWEIGPRGAEVRELRARLNMDSGYATRVLQSLERQHLVTIRPSTRDARVREVRLTRAGRAERAELDRRSDRVARSFLEPLDHKQRSRLVDAMADVERLMRASMVEIAVEDPGTADARWCVEQYFAELNRRFETGFEAGHTLALDLRELTPRSGMLLIARLRGRPVGCGALRFHLTTKPDIKRMWIAPEVRGLGVGRRMLAQLEHEAKNAGARAVRLETNRSLEEAISLYRKTGYREVKPFNAEPYAHHWFEKRLR
jgi:DNA-binding MarR family transcriptional regulator/GNAT superfamily N-acetyltransferase